MSAAPAVEFRHVSKQFGSRGVLKDVSFQIAPGETLCILGRSGVGKSVSLKLMIGLIQPDKGNVFIESEDISQFREDDISRVRQKMGFLFQSAALFDSFSVGDNLVLPLQRMTKRRSREEINSFVDETLGQVGLARDRDKMPSQLSGGMRKRAGLARALVLEPQILLIDEPSSGLDPITASEIDDLLLKVKRERGTTMVIVTHDIRGARKIADKVAVFEDGFLVGFGSFAELEGNRNETVRKLISES
jgi:phospholipid/cholesterol/gamma-HCH transport system ATP-binding protein